ncbi:MAG: hypothetical protein ACP5PJ_02590 [Acidimicrobiales bacterium]
MVRHFDANAEGNFGVGTFIVVESLFVFADDVGGKRVGVETPALARKVGTASAGTTPTGTA